MIDKEHNDLKVKKFRKNTKKILKLLSKNNLVNIQIEFNKFTTHLSCDGEAYKITLDESFNWEYIIGNVKKYKPTLGESIHDILDNIFIVNLKNELEQIILESKQVQSEIGILNKLKMDIMQINE
jgi:hypothetical protein